MCGKFQRSLTGLLVLLAVGAQAQDRYLQASGPVPLRFQAPMKPVPLPRPLPPPTPVEQPPMPTEKPEEPPLTPTSPTASPTVPSTLEPLGPPALQTSTPSSAGMTSDPINGASSSPKSTDSTLGPVPLDGDTISPQALMGFFQPQSRGRGPGPGRNSGAGVILGPTVFTPPQPAAVQPSSATYTVK